MNTHQQADYFINTNEESMNFELQFLLYPRKKLGEMNTSELKNHIRKIDEFRIKYNINDVDLLKPFQKKNYKFVEKITEIKRFLNTSEMMCNYYLHQICKLEQSLLSLPKKTPKIYVNRDGTYKFMGNEELFLFKRKQSLGI